MLTLKEIGVAKKMMLISEDTVRMALEVLSSLNAATTKERLRRNTAITTLREALKASNEVVSAKTEQKQLKAKAIAECLAVLRPAVKGKFPHEQALEELVGYIATHQPAQEPDLSKLKPENAQQMREWLADGTFAQRAIDTMFELSEEITAFKSAQQPLGFMNAGHVHEMQQGRLPYGYVYPENSIGADVALYTFPLAPQKPWVGLDDTDLKGHTKSDMIMVRHFEQMLFERNTQPCLEGLPEPIRTPPEKGTEYWTIGLGRWTWGDTTHDYSSLRNGIWRCETDVWKVRAAIRRALNIESNIAPVGQNRQEAKLKE